jgi:branched-chain amino acid aminotransferase
VSTTDSRGTHDSLPDSRNDDVLIYVNGEWVRRPDARISVFDSGFLVGDGVWEGLRLHDEVLVFLDRHLNRLFQGARAIGLNVGMTREQLTAVLYRTMELNGMRTGVHVRLMVTRGVKRTPGQDPRLAVGGSTIVIIAEHKVADPETSRRGIRLFTSAVRRGSPDYLDPKLNCHSKQHEVVALIQALDAGADEALMLDIRGFVSTCNATNFFIVRGGEVWTSTGEYCMNGITRGLVLELCRSNGIPACERNFSLTDVYDADEAFVTGTFGGLTPVIRVDGRRIGDGATRRWTERLGELYRRRIEEEIRRVREERGQ